MSELGDQPGRFFKLKDGLLEVDHFTSTEQKIIKYSPFRSLTEVV